MTVGWQTVDFSAAKILMKRLAFTTKISMSRKQALLGVCVGFLLFCLGGTYGVWESLTWLHKNEVAFLLNANSNEFMLPPEFFRVVEYNDHRLLVFMVETGGQDMLVEFRRDSQGDWQVSRREWCTVSAGSPGCFFPYYSLEGLNQAILYGCMNSCLAP